MSKRFGKKRVPGCKCEYNFTCQACLDDCVARNLADKNAFPSLYPEIEKRANELSGIVNRKINNPHPEK